MHIATNERKEQKRKSSIKETKPEQEIEMKMRECLEKLKVWQTENLMAPHGMDRFAEGVGNCKKK